MLALRNEGNARPAGPEAPERLDQKIGRLIRMQGSDPGFFVLAVHSFVESLLGRQFIPSTRDEDNFYWLLDSFREELLGKADRFLPDLDALHLLKDQHRITNAVRHDFASIDVEEARAATHLLKKFCTLYGAADLPSLPRLFEALKAWDDKRCAADLSRELVALGYKLQLAGRDNRKLTEQVQELQGAQARIDHLEKEKAVLERRLTDLSQATERKDSRLDELRARLHRQKQQFEEEQERLRARIGELQPTRDYLEALKRVTVYTRTRFDYERSITKLTREQQKVLDQISLGADFLIKGSAGTGKTLVLIRAIGKAKGREAGSLGLDLGNSVALLTFTSSLVKYDCYIAELISGENPADRITTADAFIREKLQEIEPGSVIRYGVIDELAKNYPVPGMTEKELVDEAETFIWGNDVSYEEYVDEAQDLSAADLKALKACARRCVVMAGDADQSIYNTVKLQELAERYRATLPGRDPENQPEAFRLGPPPERVSCTCRPCTPARGWTSRSSCCSCTARRSSGAATPTRTPSAWSAASSMFRSPARWTT